jgi:hypothetical protein
MKHSHHFIRFVGLRTSWGVLAWVPWATVAGNIDTLPTMWRCSYCREQGYEVA